MKVACLCCGSSASFASGPGASVGEISRLSGYEPIVMKDTSFRWICPPCEVRVRVHVRALSEILRDPLVFWDGLRHLLKRKREADDEGDQA